MKKYLEKYLDEFEYPEESKPYILAGYDYFRSQKDLSDYLDIAFESYVKGEYVWEERLKELEELTKEREVHSFTLNLVFFLCMSKHARVLYEQKGYPYELFKANFKDFNYKLIETKNRYNVWGSSCYLAWYILFFTLERFALGRLQFEIRPFRGKEPYTAHGITLNPEEPCVNMHIPSSGPLTPESVEDSFKQAYYFFKDRFPTEYVPLMCHSWLLFPEHLNMLDEKSNIVQFMKRFDLLYTTDFENYEVPFSILFNRSFNGDLSSYEVTNSLQRGYIELVKQNKPCGTTCGVTLYKPEN